MLRSRTSAATDDLCPPSRKDARDALRAALTCAVDDEVIGRNPVTAVKMTKRRQPGQRASVMHGQSMMLAGSSNRPGTDMKRCMPPSSSSSCSACVGERCSAWPGIRLIWMSPSCTWESSSSGYGISWFAARSRLRRQKHRCRCLSCAWPRWRSASSDRMPIGTVRGMAGSILGWFSPPGTARRSSPATSTAASTAA